MDSSNILFAACVVAVCCVGAAGFVCIALLVARRVMLDRMFRERSVAQDSDAGPWSWLSGVCAVIGLVALIAGLASVLGVGDPAKLLSSPWALAVCLIILGGFVTLAISSSPGSARASLDSRSDEARRGSEQATAMRRPADSRDARSRRAA